MNLDGTEHIDAVDVLIKVGIFVCFVAFGICMWLIRRERDKRKRAGSQNVTPPKISKG
jgi:hypothetical protein